MARPSIVGLGDPDWPDGDWFWHLSGSTTMRHVVALELKSFFRFGSPSPETPATTIDPRLEIADRSMRAKIVSRGEDGLSPTLGAQDLWSNGLR